MTDDRRPWITAEMASLASCADCDSDVTIVEDEPDVFTVRVRHDASCVWYRAFVRGDADQPYTRDPS